MPYDPTNLNVDVDKTIKMIYDIRPKLVIMGGSLYLFPHPLKELAPHAKAVGATIVYDAAHVYGLITGGAWPNPLDDGADIVTASTHKTFPGPQGGVILSRSENEFKVASKSIFPWFVSNHHLNRLPALAVTALEMREYGKDYAHAVVTNARRLAESLATEGFHVVGEKLGYTKSHQVAVDVSELGGGNVVAKKLEEANVIVNKNMLPWDDPSSVTDPSGIRIGVQEMTRFGMKEQDMDSIAEIMKSVLIDGKDPSLVKEKVVELRSSFIKVKYTFEIAEQGASILDASWRLSCLNLNNPRECKLIAQLTAKDLPSVLRIASSSFKEEARRPEVMGPGSIDALVRFPFLQIGAFEGSELVGFLIGELSEDWGIVDWIAVAPSIQRKGIGSQLLTEFERRVSLSGKQRVRLGTPFAVQFYEKLGYSCVGSQRVLQKVVVGSDFSSDSTFSISLKDLVSLVEDFELDSIKCFFAHGCVAVGRKDFGLLLAMENRWNREEIDVVFSKYVRPEAHLLLLSQLEARARERGAYLITERFDEPEIEDAFREGWSESSSPLSSTMYYMEKRLRWRLSNPITTADMMAKAARERKRPLNPRNVAMTPPVTTPMVLPAFRNELKSPACLPLLSMPLWL